MRTGALKLISECRLTFVCVDAQIFLLGNGRLVLGDLGISKKFEAGGTARNDFTKTSIGTPCVHPHRLSRTACVVLLSFVELSCTAGLIGSSDGPTDPSALSVLSACTDRTALEFARLLVVRRYYMSPEMFSSKPYDYKSDVWALGCVCVCGRQ